MKYTLCFSLTDGALSVLRDRTHFIEEPVCAMAAMTAAAAAGVVVDW